MKAIVVLSAKGKSTTEKIVSEAGKTLNLLKSSEVHRLAYLFRNAHAIAKQNRPLTDYKWLCHIDKSKGLDIGNTYQTGMLGFYSLRQIFFRSDSFSKLPDQMSDKLSWIFDMSDVVLSTPHLSRI